MHLSLYLWLFPVCLADRFSRRYGAFVGVLVAHLPSLTLDIRVTFKNIYILKSFESAGKTHLTFIGFSFVMHWF